MNYSERILGKHLDELTYGDVVTYFKEERTETESLEFKSSAGGKVTEGKSNIDAVIKGICAMLNSDGGLLIWGSATEKPSQADPLQKVAAGDLTPINDCPDKDSFDRKVSSCIQSMPVSFRSKLCTNDKGQKILVTEVQKSLGGPHQIKGVYYIRVGASTIPAPHYFVESLFRRITYPNIEVALKVTKLDRPTGNYIISFTCMIANWSPLQNEYDVGYSIETNKGFLMSSGLIGKSDLYPSVNGVLNQRNNNNGIKILPYGKLECIKDAVKIEPVSLPGGKFTITVRVA